MTSANGAEDQLLSPNSNVDDGKLDSGDAMDTETNALTADMPAEGNASEAEPYRARCTSEIQCTMDDSTGDNPDPAQPPEGQSTSTEATDKPDPVEGPSTDSNPKIEQPPPTQNFSDDSLLTKTGSIVDEDCDGRTTGTGDYRSTFMND